MQSNVPVPHSPYQRIAHAPESRFCPSCGGVGEPKLEARGSAVVEILLWLTCVGGVFYSIWRRSNKIERCPYCNATGLVLPDSPAARAAPGSR